MIQVWLVDLLRREHSLTHCFTEADTRGLPFNDFDHGDPVISGRGGKFLSTTDLRIVSLSDFSSERIVMQLLHFIDVGRS